MEGNIPNRPKMVIIGAPHTSNWDALYGFAAFLAYGAKISWMAKHTLFKGFWGKLLIALGGVPIQRSKNHGLVDQMVSEFKTRSSLLLVVTPEGTRKRVEQWKTGFYVIAQKAHVPILMGFMDYSRKRLGFGPLLEPGGDVKADMRAFQDFYGSLKGRNEGDFNPEIVIAT